MVNHRLAVLVTSVALLLATAIAVDAATIRTAIVTRVGAGAARLTVFATGTGALYVNLKGLVPGRWNEHLWAGTCESLGARVAVLPGLLVPPGGALARTNVLTASQAAGRTLRLVNGPAVLCATFGALASALSPTGPTETAQVVRVVDGDTIVVDRGRGSESLRYIGMDTPETVDPSQPVQWMGMEAANANRRLVEGREVVLERDVSEVDRYGRLLRDVWVRDGTTWVLVNLRLVEQGFAQVTTYPPDVKYVDALLAAQRTAREQGQGLWGAPPLIPSPSGSPTPTASPRPSPGPGSRCDPAYPGVCIPPPPPDLDCGDIAYRNFTVLPPDPHRFDGDHDGIGCET